MNIVKLDALHLNQPPADPIVFIPYYNLIPYGHTCPRRIISHQTPQILAFITHPFSLPHRTAAIRHIFPTHTIIANPKCAVAVHEINRMCSMSCTFEWKKCRKEVGTNIVRVAFPICRIRKPPVDTSSDELTPLTHTHTHPNAHILIHTYTHILSCSIFYQRNFAPKSIQRYARCSA